jgi:hypothetical protein
MTNGNYQDPVTRTPWKTALLSIMPMLIAVPAAVLQNYGLLPWSLGVQISISLLAVSIAFLLGALKKFPRWSYIYPVYFVILTIFGIFNLINRIPRDMRAETVTILSVILFVALLIGLVPVLRIFYSNILRDWTLLSYALFACTLFLLSNHDQGEVPRLNLLVLLPGLIAILGALVHLRLESGLLRVGTLLVSMLVAVFVWVLPIFAVVMGSRDNLLIVVNLLLTIWGLLGGLILAPILIGIFTRRIHLRTA